MQYIPVIIVEIAAVVFFIIGLKTYLREKKASTATAKTIGTVVKYSSNNSGAPVVEYVVDNKTFRERLKYTSITIISSPFNSVKDTSVDLLAAKLKIKRNSMISINSLMQKHFPIGSEMTVYYLPDTPEIAYVERYVKSYLGQLFIGSAVLAFFSGLFLTVVLINIR